MPIDPIHQALRLDILPAEGVRPLRTRELRPNFGPDQLCKFDQDESPQTTHFALLDRQDEPAAVATFFPQECPEFPRQAGVQLRGMCVKSELKRRGLGRRLLDGALPQLALIYPDAQLLWCDARISASRFYHKMGFQPAGEVFELPEIGPHQVMWRPMPALIARQK